MTILSLLSLPYLVLPLCFLLPLTAFLLSPPNSRRWVSSNVHTPNKRVTTRKSRRAMGGKGEEGVLSRVPAAEPRSAPPKTQRGAATRQRRSRQHPSSSPLAGNYFTKKGNSTDETGDGNGSDKSRHKTLRERFRIPRVGGGNLALESLYNSGDGKAAASTGGSARSNNINNAADSKRKNSSPTSRPPPLNGHQGGSQGVRKKARVSFGKSQTKLYDPSDQHPLAKEVGGGEQVGEEEDDVVVVVAAASAGRGKRRIDSQGERARGGDDDGDDDDDCDYDESIKNKRRSPPSSSSSIDSSCSSSSSPWQSPPPTSSSSSS